MTIFKPSARGFTVIELLSVIGIMLVIMAIATPSFYYWLPTYRLSAGARQVAADLQLARMKAISQNTSYRLRFTANNNYQIWKNDGGWIQEPNTGTFELPDGITVTNGTPFNTSDFQSRGTASATFDIELTNDGGTTTTHVCIKTVGRVHVEDTTC